MGRLASAFRRFVGRPIRAVLPERPWLRVAVIAIPVLVVLALLAPVFGLLEQTANLVTRVVVPLLESRGGRLLALNVLLLVAGAVAFVSLRSRLRGLRQGLLLRRHVEGVRHLLDDDPRRARDAFRRVVKSRSAPPPEFPSIADDARIKLARIALADGEPDQAIHWLARVREPGLPPELRRSLAHLRAEAFATPGAVLPETLERELREALTEVGDDARLLSLLRDVVRGTRGRESEVADLQERILERSCPRFRVAARQQLVDDLLHAASAARARGKPDEAAALARRAHKADPDSPHPGCVLGEARAAAGDLRGAVREWGATRSPRGLELIARLLDDHPGMLTPRELLEGCPTRGAVLLVAREYARRGEFRKAERAARSAGKALTPSSATLLAQVLELTGRSADSERMCQEALRRLLAPHEASG